MAAVGKTAGEVISDFFVKIRETMEERVRVACDSSVYNAARTQWVVTVPNIWSEMERDRIKRAAVEAGMGRDLILLSELNAAVVHVFDSMSPRTLRGGDTFIVCDAGGGTIQTATYTIARESPRCFNQIAGSGQVGGGVFVDLAFQSHLRRRLPANILDQIMQEDPAQWREILHEFQECVKKEYDPSIEYDADCIFTLLVRQPGRKLKTAIHLERDHLHEIFDQEIRKIVVLLEAEVIKAALRGSPPKAVIMVGGFGGAKCVEVAVNARLARPIADIVESSPYHPTDAEFKNLRDSKLSAPLQIIQPSLGAAAVALGAARYGVDHDEEVAFWLVPKCSFGLTRERPWQWGHDPQEWMVRDAETGSRWVVAEMEWGISKSKAFMPGAVFLYSFERRYGIGEKIVGFSHHVFCSYGDLGHRPKRLQIGMHSQCTCRVDPDKIPRGAFKIVRVDGTLYRQLDYKIAMKVSGRLLVVSVQAGGSTIAETSTGFD
ncbi:hypothetical protein BDZ85DRAFT_255696 [Elsinoe ampelina]|uniref:Hsp70 protein-domain-containing protein n=1 Tax=Elsinoe ampelina TaxID=302913 RepID=A0A6A6GSG0_9PEZI|nr:hypothetical protein BDZ85DRAFT_255696 [Elsinoe ampelina]